MSSLKFLPLRLEIALLTSALLVSSCSDSGNSQSPAEPGAPATPIDNPTVPDPEVPEPGVDSTTTVNFDITVPAYVSDALQVRVLWGEKEIAGTWVGDEFWTASGDFSTGINDLLVVKFYDANGDTTLGSYARNFTPGENSSESYQITADQFNTDRWDSDYDGASNINELIAGTDPWVADTVELQAQALYRSEALDALEMTSGFYESLITIERPYFVQTQDVQPIVYEPVYSDGIEQTVAIDLDESGTGSFSDLYLRTEPSNNHRENKVATRTNTGNSILWAGMDDFLDSSAGLVRKIEFTTETRVIDAQTREQEGVMDRETSGDVSGANTPIHLTYSLTGNIIDNSASCEINAGTIVHDALYVLTTDPDWTATESIVTISKEVSDQYWSISIAALNEQILEEFLVQAIDATFYCDLGDLQ